jgi:hypothetical protein
MRCCQDLDQAPPPVRADTTALVELLDRGVAVQRWNSPQGDGRFVHPAEGQAITNSVGCGRRT